MYLASWPYVIKRASLGGAPVEILVEDRGKDASAIGLDLSGGKIYWGEWAEDFIWRANLDGSQVETFLTVRSHGLALDVGGGKIYWTNWINGAVQRANLDGSQVETLVSGLEWPSDIALGP